MLSWQAVSKGIPVAEVQVRWSVRPGHFFRRLVTAQLELSGKKEQLMGQ